MSNLGLHRRQVGPDSRHYSGSWFLPDLGVRALIASLRQVLRGQNYCFSPCLKRESLLGAKPRATQYDIVHKGLFPLMDLPKGSYHQFSLASQVCNIIPVLSWYGNQNPFHPMSTRKCFVSKGQSIPDKIKLSEGGLETVPCSSFTYTFLHTSHCHPRLALTEFPVGGREFKNSRGSVMEIRSQKMHLNFICYKFGVGIRHVALHAHTPFDCVRVPEISCSCL